MIHLGIDIGGTKTTVGLFDAQFQRIDAVTVPTNPHEGCRVLAKRIAEQYEALLKRQGVSADEVITGGVASPGPLDPQQGRIVYIPTMGFRDEPLIEYLTEEIQLVSPSGCAPSLVLENDTNLAALCESVFGGGKEFRTVVYVTVSTGVGCGIAIDRRILSGGGFAAGELGHLKVHRDGKLCGCGGKGCLELYASGTAIAQIASDRFGRTMGAKEVFALARQGNATATSIVREAADELGYAIAAVYQVLDPDICVLGGSVLKDQDILMPLLWESAERYVQSIPGRQVRLTVSEYDGEQVVLGAAYYGAQMAAERRDG